MKWKLTINGESLHIDADTVTIEQEIETPKNETIFERKYSDYYYYIEYDGAVESDRDVNSDGDIACFNVGNYCRDEDMIRQRALHETLNRLLWRYSEEHDGDNSWDGLSPHYYIYLSPDKGCFMCGYSYGCKRLMDVYFKCAETAENAIRDIIEPFMRNYPDFVW